MRQASPRAIPRFVPSFFTPLVISPAPKFTFHVVASVYRFSIHRHSATPLHPPIHSSRWHTTRRRRDDCTSLPVKFFSSVEYGSPDRDESIREMPLARLERQSKRRSKYWPTIFYLFPMLRRASYFDKRVDTQS